MTWFEIGSFDDFPAGETRELVVHDRIVAVCHALPTGETKGSLFALDGVCPHQGGPLGKGVLDGCTLTCPWHGWQFDVQDGQSLLSPHVKHPVLPVKVEDGKVWVALEEA